MIQGPVASPMPRAVARNIRRCILHPRRCDNENGNWGKSGAYSRWRIYIPLCFWSLESNWLDSGLIVLHGVPFVQRIRTTSACE